MSLTIRETAELRRIVKMRFEVLGSQLAQRENEVANAIRKQIVKEHEDTAKKARAEVKKLAAETSKLVDALDAKIRDMEALLRRFEDQGVALQGGHDGRTYIHRHLGELRNGLARIGDSFVPRDLATKVRDRLEEMKLGAGSQRLNLKEMELELLEELAVNGLQSETAREFLDKIPTVDTLVPMPNGNTGKKKLGAG